MVPVTPWIESNRYRLRDKKKCIRYRRGKFCCAEQFSKQKKNKKTNGLPAYRTSSVPSVFNIYRNICDGPCAVRGDHDRGAGEGFGVFGLCYLITKINNDGGGGNKVASAVVAGRARKTRSQLQYDNATIYGGGP